MECVSLFHTFGCWSLIFTRCMTAGNIYEAVPRDEFPVCSEDDTKYCVKDPMDNSYFRQGPANGWYQSKVVPAPQTLVFDFERCLSVYPPKTAV